MNKEQKQLEALERRAADLQRERESFSVLLANARADYDAYQIEADLIFAKAERSGNTKLCDPAEEKLLKLSMAVKRKDAALRDCERDITENAAALHEARVAVKRARVDEIKAEARKIAETITLSDVAAWARLKVLWVEVAHTVSELRAAQGGSGKLDEMPFTDPSVAYARLALGVYRAVGWNTATLWNLASSSSNGQSTPQEALFDEKPEQSSGVLAGIAAVMTSLGNS